MREYDAFITRIPDASELNTFRMKVNVLYKSDRFTIDILPSDTVDVVKRKIWNILEVKSEILFNQQKSEFIIYHCGVLLQGYIVAEDIGLVSGETLRCRHRPKPSSSLQVFVEYENRTIDLRDELNIETVTIGDIRIILQNKLGIPISMFRLMQKQPIQFNTETRHHFQFNPETRSRELFDHHLLKHYQLQAGDVIFLEIWKGTKDFVFAALHGDIIQTLKNIPCYYDNPNMNRYMLRVALFIAAHMNYRKLAAQVMQRGIRCEEGVSEHPSRQWCLLQSHREVHKTPVHQAAQRGSFQCLELFIRRSPACITKHDGYEQTPSSLASRYRRIECCKLLITSHFMYSKIYGFKLATYGRIMEWCHNARERVMSFKGQLKKSLLLQSTLGRAKQACLGNGLMVNGIRTDSFDSVCNHSQNMNTNSRSETKPIRFPNVKRIEEFQRVNRSEEILRFPSRKISVRQYNINKSSTFIPSKTLASTDDKISKYSIEENGGQTCEFISSKTFESAKLRGLLTRNTSELRHSSVHSVKGNITGKLIRQATGLSAHDLACCCFEMGELFKTKGWRTQISIAIRSSKNIIERRQQMEKSNQRIDGEELTNLGQEFSKLPRHQLKISKKKKNSKICHLTGGDAHWELLFRRNIPYKT